MPGCTESSLTNFGPEITFGRGMADFYAGDPNTSVAVIKYANGGTRLYDQWIAPSGPDYVAFKDTVTAGLAALRARYPSDTVRVAGMIWMQGENDASSDVYANAYQSNLTNFIADVRGNYGADLPFVIGRLSANQIGLAYPTGHQTVMNAQTAVADADSRVGLVNTDSYSMKSDFVHFDTAGQQSLGYDFATVMQATMAETPIRPTPSRCPRSARIIRSTRTIAIPRARVSTATALRREPRRRHGGGQHHQRRRRVQVRRRRGLLYRRTRLGQGSRTRPSTAETTTASRSGPATSPT